MNKQRQLFGTDGIRGVAGEFPLSQAGVYAIGQALGRDLASRDLAAGGSAPRAVIGQDTRESSAWIADRLTQGLASQGVVVESAGVITTPGVAYLARTRDFAAGVVVSASHNPWTDNGIKIFSGDGYKLPDAHELAIEKDIFAMLSAETPALRNATGSSLPGNPELRRAYIDWLAQSVPTDLRGLRVLVDCANGAAAVEAPELFQACGIQASFLCAAPDGRNINHDCGALHPANLARAVAAQPGDFALGVTFDGDADRALFSDAEGRVVNGDGVLLLAARDMKSRGVLANDMVVATTMSNMGLEVALREAGIQMLRANVGDRYVLEEMRRTGATLGGEQSGHILFRDHDATTGDGLLTALRVMEVMARTGRSLADLVSGLKVFPQTIQNVRVLEKTPLHEVAEIEKAILAAERELEGNGRVVVRYSGTEALARVMIEAQSEEKMTRLAASIAGAIREKLGA